MDSTRYVLGLDSGFASSGWALVRLGEAFELEGLGVIRTQKSGKKLTVKSADDNLRRGREITGVLAGKLDRLAVICTEAPSLPRNASTSFKLGMYYGILAAISGLRDIPVVQVTPQGLKKGVCGNAKASKEEIAYSLNGLFDGVPEKLLREGRVPAGQHEHAYDALGAIIACSDSEVVRLARRMA